MTDPQPQPSPDLALVADALRAAANRLDPSPMTPPNPDPTSTPSDGPKRFSVPMVVAVYGATYESGVFVDVMNEAQFLGNMLDAVGAMTAPPSGPADVETLFVTAATAYGQPNLANGLDYDVAWASLSASLAAMPPWAF